MAPAAAPARSRSSRRSSCSLLWDLAAIARGHWGFNPRYVTGWELPGNVPVEELVFFVVIPICGLLTLEAVRRILPSRGPLMSRA